MANEFKVNSNNAEQVAVGGFDNVNNEWHRARVLAQAPGDGDYGLVVRPVGTSSIRPTPAATATESQVANSAASVTILAANANRLGASIENSSPARLHLKMGATATTTAYSVSLGQYGYFEVPYGYTGRIDGIWASSTTGSAEVTEYTP